jgi:hypothetical protein
MSHGNRRFGPLFVYDMAVVDKPPCIDDASVVTAPEQRTVESQERFTAAIELRNTGSCTWSAAEDYAFANTNGETLGAAAVRVVPQEIAPNEVLRLDMDMRAPDTPATYESRWQLKHGERRFGPTVEVEVVVPEPARDGDLGFRPNPNGYAVANHASAKTRDMFVQYFGAANVFQSDGKTMCPAVQAYYDTMRDRRLAGGYNCVGFSVSSLLGFRGPTQPEAGRFEMPRVGTLFAERDQKTRYGPTYGYYSLSQTTAELGREYSAWQRICSGGGGGTASITSAAVDHIRRAIYDKEPVILVLAGRVHKDGTRYSHAVVPYRTVEERQGEVRVYIYDSEDPGKENSVLFTTAGDGKTQWSYRFKGSMRNQNYPSGSPPSTCDSLWVIPLEMYIGQGELPAGSRCPSGSSVWAMEAGSGAEGAPSVPGLSDAGDGHGLMAFVNADGDWSLIDSEGRRLGRGGEGRVSEIPGALVLPVLSSGHPGGNQQILIPPGEYTIASLDPVSGQTSTTLFGSEMVLKFDARLKNGGEAVPVKIAPDLSQVDVEGAGRLGDIATEFIATTADRSRVAALDISPSEGCGDLMAAFDRDTVAVSNASGNALYTATFEQTGTEAGTLVSPVITIAADEAHFVRPSDWSEGESGSLTVEIDRGRDGTIDERRTVSRARQIYLPYAQGGVRPELRPARLAGWDGPVVPSSVRRTHTVGMLVGGRPTFVDVAIENAGPIGALGDIRTDLYLDGRLRYSVWARGGLAPHSAAVAEDIEIADVQPGWHTLRIVIDAEGSVEESDEGNNSWERRFFWGHAAEGGAP